MQLITGSCGGERCINMAVTLREIIKQVQHLEMKLVAGATGLDHEVSWTHMVDSDEYSRAMKSHFRKFGNQMSGSGNHLCNYASLLA